MGRMKYGKPQPHSNKSKVVPRKGETKPEHRQEEMVPENFRRRKVQSDQADRYNDPIDSENSDGEEEYDETKDFEYIKKHYSGPSSHFQFKDEKEWNEEVEDDDDNEFLQLNLLQLAQNMAEVDTCEKLQLGDLDSNRRYCVSNLLADVNIHYTETGNDNEVPKCSRGKGNNNTFVWNFTGIETYHKSKKRTKSNLEKAEINFKRSDINLKKAEINQHADDKNYKNTNNNKSSSLTGNTVSKCKESTPPNDNTSVASLDKNIEVVESQQPLKDKSMKISIVENENEKGTMKDNVIITQEDLDLDLLLETQTPLEDNTKDSHHTMTSSNTEGSDVKELDDWLDSILD